MALAVAFVSFIGGLITVAVLWHYGALGALVGAPLGASLLALIIALLLDWRSK